LTSIRRWANVGAEMTSTKTGKEEGIKQGYGIIRSHRGSEEKKNEEERDAKCVLGEGEREERGERRGYGGNAGVWLLVVVGGKRCLEVRGCGWI
jgi:hypothetical protein